VPSSEVFAVTFPEAATVGSSSSVTVTVNDDVAVLFEASVAVYVIVVVPIGKVYVPT